MEERKVIIHINRLGPIVDSEIELKPFMVFSGDSGVGKSYAALLVHYVYRVLCNSNDLMPFFEPYLVQHNYFEDISFEEEEIDELLFDFTLNDFETWCNRSAVSYLEDMLGFEGLEADFQIHFYGMPDIRYEFRMRRNRIEIGDDPRWLYTLYIPGFNGMNTSNYLINGGSTFYGVVFHMILSQCYSMKLYQTFLLPPSRGALVGLSDVARSSILASMGMYREFLEDLSNIKATKTSDTKQLGKLNALSQKMIDGQIHLRNSELFYAMDTCEIPITAAASSVKELAPFALMMQKGVLPEYAILFEEPESHLHPELQIKVADLLAFAYQIGSHIQITTHSDYLLRRLNDLIRLDELKTHLSEEEYLSFCQANLYNPEITLPSSAVAALYFEREGEAVKIRKQEVEDGIPFDTFKSAVNKQLLSSVKLSDKLEEIRGCGN